MINTLSIFIGTRYIGSKRSNGFLAFVSIFALLGMTLGVFSLIVVLSVMNGFNQELTSRVLRVIPHGFVQHKKGFSDWQPIAAKLEQQEYIHAVSPFVSNKALVGYRHGVRGVELQGVDPVYEKNVSVISDYMLLGTMEDLQPKQYNIILGSLLARYMGVTIGDKVSVTLPMVSVTPAGVFPRTKRFRVVGIFEAGAQVDETLALIHIEDAKKLFRTGDQIQGLRLRFQRIEDASTYRSEIENHLPEGFDYIDWSQSQGSLFQSIKMEKIVVSVMLSVIIAVAAFNIVTSLIMLVNEKRSDIAVLRTMGLSKGSVVSIFVVQGVLLGMIGIFIGALSGMSVAIYLPKIMSFLESTFGLTVFDPNVYFVSTLPSEWKLTDTIWICVFGMILSFVATIYPAYRASKIAPAEALRYEI